ncbi:hypothetical protein N7462_000919 [Penicillium macrosclerotiorum]|uniref:uncharacterized protein n=1 Tax=Penicillium macrosclerotiorum TaxID=303699 RepID=UPI002548F981|nr:uncharacterized protein N7462_000919 [Penicillium macrosclerotiorum]KAJ5698914.1 hypothetical protein N7462_000919 [Penicillium macrosclerotiorum]
MAPRKGNDGLVTRSGVTVPPGHALDRVSKPKSARSASKPKRARGRPFKIPVRSDSSNFRPALMKGPSAAMSMASAPPSAPRRLSMLEALPVEVIEQIFLHSLNLNLPRASPALAAAVSREHIYNLLILLACFDDHPEWPRSVTIERIFAPLEYTPLEPKARARLQEAVFRSRWCTMERVCEQIPTIQNLTIHRHWFNAGITMEPEQQAALERFMNREDDTVRMFNGQGPPMRSIGPLPEAERRRMARMPGPHQYELHVTPMRMIQLFSPTLKVQSTFPAIGLTHFPDRLVRGRSTGFTPGDVAYLEMLRMCSKNYSCPGIPSLTVTTVNRTNLHEGVSRAIKSQNYNALVSLLKIDEFIFRFHESKSGPVFYTIPQDHFLAVTRFGREKPHLNCAFFDALIRASAESIPPNASEIMAWTLDNVRLGQRHPSKYNEINGKFARWLSNFMLRLPEQIEFVGEDPTAQLFNCGKLDLLDMEGCRFLDEVLEPFQGPYENYMGKSSFNTEDYWVKKK